MKNIKRQNLYLSIIAIFLGIIVIFDFGLSKLLKDTNTKAFFKDIDPSQVNQIEISKPGNEELKLTNKNEIWYIGQYKADQLSVNDIFNIIKELKANETVSKNANNFKTYALDEISAIDVKIYSGKDLLAQFYIGSKGPSYNSQYLRLPNKNEVYLVNKNLEDIFKKQIDDFRDKTILKIQSDSIESVIVGGLNISDLNKIKDKFNPLNANGFIDPGEATNEAPEQKREAFDISIKLKNQDSPIIIKVGKTNTDGNYLVTTSLSNQMYTVNSYVIDSIVEAASPEPTTQAENETQDNTGNQ